MSRTFDITHILDKVAEGKRSSPTPRPNKLQGLHESQGHLIGIDLRLGALVRLTRSNERLAKKVEDHPEECRMSLNLNELRPFPTRERHVQQLGHYQN
jgi:hypothetical protein